MTAQHTPTPWKLHNNGRIETADNKIVICSMPHYGNGKSEAGEANAAFIVKATNFHDQLVGALEWALESIPDSAKKDKINSLLSEVKQP